MEKVRSTIPRANFHITRPRRWTLLVSVTFIVYVYVKYNIITILYYSIFNLLE